MRINKIILYNFGSYEGETIFNTSVTEDERNIILVGGKNGAGKTTLFTAMRLCLYGYMSMGYKNANSFYSRAIIKLINNNAKISRPAAARISMNFEMNNGRDVDEYILERAWVLDESLNESFSVIKNGIELTRSEIADFEKFLLSLIPPELFNLYFFDGEKIADFFMEEGGNARIKDAFLTLCGYDTFEIMRKNFKRIGGSTANKAPVIDEYLAAKDAVHETNKKQQELEGKLKQCLDEIDTCEADIIALEKDYHQKGGISQEEWNRKLEIIKEEEKKRESYNALLKKWANDIVPFIMIRQQIEALSGQIESENRMQKLKNFCEVLLTPSIKNLLGNKIEILREEAEKQFGVQGQVILDLSLEQSALLLAQIQKILEFDAKKVANCKRAIKKSLALTAKTRQELDNSNISSVQEYMQRRAQLFEYKSLLLVQRVKLEQQLADHKELMQQSETHLARVQAQFEDELKKASIGDISGRAIIMLDKLQQLLYRRQIEKVEKFFREEIKTLMRKTKFIDDICIDDDFNTRIYRNEEISVQRLRESLSTNSEEQFITLFGNAAYQKLKVLSGEESFENIYAFFEEFEAETIELPVEIDKTSLSNGEKQIFIMALYHSLVRLCSHEIPFIIDTPFARIDTEHRRNISKHFFSKLKGQVFILSTNEEINSAHVQIMHEKIAATYMLENSDNRRTTVSSNRYFEEE